MVWEQFPVLVSAREKSAFPKFGTISIPERPTNQPVILSSDVVDRSEGPFSLLVGTTRCAPGCGALVGALKNEIQGSFALKNGAQDDRVMSVRE